jgi:hypothetical protein
VKLAARWRVRRACSDPTICCRIVPAARVQVIAGISSAPYNHFCTAPNRCVR